jgi:hypothetical protein
MPEHRTAWPEVMSPPIQNGAMMIREGFLLPDSSQFESLSYSDTWRTLVGMDSFAFDRKLGSVGLHLFFIAGELRVIELGRGASAVRRGMKRILARGRKSNLNCMEITRVRAAYFLGLPCIDIRAGSFHVQKSAVLQSGAQRKSEQNARDWACG